MKRLVKFICMVVIVAFAFAVPVTATPVTYTFYHPNATGENPWAILTAYDPVANGGTYIYQYTLENVGAEGQSIHMLDLPVGAYTTLTPLQSGASDPYVFSFLLSDGNNYRFIWESLDPGETSTVFGFEVDLMPGTGTATIHNTGYIDEEDNVSSALISYGGGPGSDPNPVPEPTTLLLVGIGLLGGATARRLRR